MAFRTDTIPPDAVFVNNGSLVLVESSGPSGEFGKLPGVGGDDRSYSSDPRTIIGTRGGSRGYGADR